MDLISKRWQASVFARGSEAASSQRKGRLTRMHSPLNPLLVSTSLPILGTLRPATARQVIPRSPANATAAPVPRVMEQARFAISVRAAYRSPPRDLNSYCTVVETASVDSVAECDAPDSVSRLNATAAVWFLGDPPPNGESHTTQRGAFQLGVDAFWVSHSRKRARASSGRSVKRTPARPRASAHAT